MRSWLRKPRRAPRCRRLWLAVLAAYGAFASGPAQASPPDIITQARYAEPTTRYDHGVLGDAVEWGALVLTVDKCLDCATSQVETVTIRLPQSKVFEDLAPRIITDNDGLPLVMTVESDLNLGARLALYDQNGLRAATPFIGRPHRWLAPIGAADFDGDGAIEIAYIDRPHLAKTLKIWQLGPGGLTFESELKGLTNHRIGWNFIPGGIRDCGQGPEMIVASGDWRRVMAVRLEAGILTPRILAPYQNPESLNAQFTCRN